MRIKDFEDKSPVQSTGKGSQGVKGKRKKRGQIGMTVYKGVQGRSSLGEYKSKLKVYIPETWKVPEQITKQKNTIECNGITKKYIG